MSSELDKFINKLLECGDYEEAAEFAGYKRSKGRRLYNQNLEAIQERMTKELSEHAKKAIESAINQRLG